MVVLHTLNRDTDAVMRAVARAAARHPGPLSSGRRCTEEGVSTVGRGGEAADPDVMGVRPSWAARERAPTHP